MTDQYVVVPVTDDSTGWDNEAEAVDEARKAVAAKGGYAVVARVVRIVRAVAEEIHGPA